MTLFLLLALLMPAKAAAQAQPPSLPCRFHGTVEVNGAPVPDGTAIRAVILGDVYTATTPSVYGPSTYMVQAAPEAGTYYLPGTQVSFAIDGRTAPQKSTWTDGGNKEVNLTGYAPPTPPPPPEPTPRPSYSPAPAPTPPPTQPPTPTPTPRPLPPVGPPATPAATTQSSLAWPLWIAGWVFVALVVGLMVWVRRQK